MIKYLFILTTLLLLALPLHAQQDEEVLFSVDGLPVTAGEFRYIYGKTNGPGADFSRESVMEYLDLYERFKLKVARARDMGLDTVVALQNELEGYRKQLADNYLVDREVTEKLVDSLYARQKTDVDFSHILFKVSGDDTLTAYSQAMEMRRSLTPENFAGAAETASDDSYSKDQGGRIGYVSAPLPRGLHQLEAALWSAAVGEVGGPLRSAAGYHLFLKHATRPALGEVEIAHVLIRKEGSREKAVRARQAITDGEPFESVAAEYSEDDKTSKQGGYIGFFGINRYNKEFERAAFALAEDGQVSEIVESPAGFHILQRISRRGIQPLEGQRPLLEAIVKQDDRFTEARRDMVERLNAKYGTKTMDANLQTYTDGLDSSFFDLRKTFVGDATTGNAALLEIGGNEFSTADFEDYLAANARLRSSLQRRGTPADAARDLYARWVDDQVEAYAEAQLEERFPEFKALMREYREGILLFEATKIEVWDRASEDTTGLQKFFSEHQSNYTYGPRAEVEIFTTATGDKDALRQVLERAAQSGAEAAVEAFDDESLRVETDLYEEDRLPEGLKMATGSHTIGEEASNRGEQVAYLVRGVQPGRAKELSEARGYVIADYQDQLEREWVDRLRKQYDVRVNKKVLNKLIRN